MALDEVVVEIQAWQRVTFPKATPESVATHLLREAYELLGDPRDPDELADVFMLIAGLAQTTGVDLAMVVRRKLDVNRSRQWGQPDEFGVVEHVRVEPAR